MLENMKISKMFYLKKKKNFFFFFKIFIPFKKKKISRNVPGRNSKQCKERWQNVLNPFVKKGKLNTERG